MLLENEWSLFVWKQKNIARPNPDGEGYEIIAGHRRKAACEWGGITDIPVVIRNLDDEQAIIAMVDSNLQRENIKPHTILITANRMK